MKTLSQILRESMDIMELNVNFYKGSSDDNGISSLNGTTRADREQKAISKREVSIKNSARGRQASVKKAENLGYPKLSKSTTFKITNSDFDEYLNTADIETLARKTLDRKKFNTMIPNGSPLKAELSNAILSDPKFMPLFSRYVDVIMDEDDETSLTNIGNQLSRIASRYAKIYNDKFLDSMKK